MSNLINNSNKKIPEGLIRDPFVSHGAFRVYVYLLHQDTGKISNRNIMESIKIKDPRTIASYFSELIHGDYIERNRVRDDNGRINGGFNYIVK